MYLYPYGNSGRQRLTRRINILFAIRGRRGFCGTYYLPRPAPPMALRYLLLKYRAMNSLCRTKLLAKFKFLAVAESSLISDHHNFWHVPNFTVTASAGVPSKRSQKPHSWIQYVGLGLHAALSFAGKNDCLQVSVNRCTKYLAPRVEAMVSVGLLCCSAQTICLFLQCTARN